MCKKGIDPKLIAMSFMILLSVLTTACTDNDDAADSGFVNSSSISFSQDTIEASVKGRYYDVSLKSTGLCIAHCDNDWISVENDSVNNGEDIDIQIATSSEPRTRYATVTLQLVSDTTQKSKIVVKQHGYLEDKNNSSEDFLGWGYDVTKDIDSVSSTTVQVLDQNKIEKLANTLGEQIITNETRRYTKNHFYSGATFEEISTSVSSKSTTSSIFSPSKTCIKYATDYSSSSTSYGMANIKTVVKEENIDQAMLKWLISHGYDIYTEQFKKDATALINGKKNLDDFINEYGSDVVTNTELGASLDLWMEYDKTKVVNEKNETELCAGAILGYNISASNHSIFNTTTSITQDVKHQKINIRGGKDSEKEALQRCTNSLTPGTKMDLSIYANWLNSVTSSDASTTDIITFDTMPIAELFNDATLRNKITTAVEAKMKRNAKYATMLKNTEERNIINIDNLNFDTNGTLVKVVYRGDKPIAEICNEFVPAIRADKRVNIIYPLADGKPSIRHGIYLGDGSSHAPLYVSFANGKAEVLSIINAPNPITKLYCIRGSLYLTNMGISITAATNQIEDAYMSYYYEEEHHIPIVKIGSDYWNRCYVDADLNFGYYDQDFDIWKVTCYKADNNYYYFPIVDGIDPAFSTLTSDEISDTRWCMPDSAKINNLKRYIGNNAKSLFKNQQSGFDAQFRGYYGNRDLFNGTKYSAYAIRYGNYCFIPYKDGNSVGCALVLDKTYNYSKPNADANSDDFFSVRLSRSDKYQYRNKE